MNKPSQPSLILAATRLVSFLALASLCVPSVQSADAIAHPVHVTGEVRFSNRTQAIVDALNDRRAALFSGSTDTVTPALRFEASTSPAAGTPGEPTVRPFHYDLMLEGAPAGTSPGYTYSVNLNLLLPAQYVLRGQSTTALHDGDTPPPFDFEDCPAMLDVRFVDAPGGAPVSVTKASLLSYEARTPNLHAIVYNASGTGYKLVVRSGVPLHLTTVCYRGSDPAVDLVKSLREVEIPTPLDPDEVKVLEVVVPSLTAPGGITGRVEMLREIPVAQGGAPYALNTVMVADTFGGDAFWADGRYEFLGGTPGTPAFGPFELKNLIASEDFGPSFGTLRYRVWGRMQFGAGHAANLFRIPSLTGDSRPLVPRGATVGLGDTFVMDPGYVNGQVVLQGPPETAGFRSPLRHVRTASDLGTAAWLTTLYSSVEARGLDEIAPGATESAHDGLGAAEFDGAFDGGSQFIGSYRLILAGLKRQASVWDLSRFNLCFDSRGSADPFILGKLLITDRRPGRVTVTPSSELAKDQRYCFGYRTVHFQAPPGTRSLRPAISVEGHAADYDVATGAGEYLGTGVPLPFLGEETTTGEGLVRLMLPAGAYILTPSVKIVAEDGTVSEFTLPPLSSVVNCADEGDAPPCLMVNISTPACAGDSSVRITGSVSSCTNKVTRLVWDQGDNVQHELCADCGANPTFAFDLPVSGPCKDHSFTVTAYSGNAAPAYVTTIIPADRIAPTMQCPSNLLVTCSGPQGIPVNYPGPVVTDNCDPHPFSACSPVSGSWFPLGQTEVFCTAIDRCGNSNRCSFTVTVMTNCPPTQPCLELRCPTNVTAYLCGSNCVSAPYSVWASNHCSPNDLGVTLDPPAGTCLPLGTTWVRAVAVGSGQTNECSFPVTVMADPNCHPPTNCVEILCPVNRLVVTCGYDSVPVEYTIWASNHCRGASLPVSCSPPPGSLFAPGEKRVECWASDGGESARCSFVVTVVPDPDCSGPERPVPPTCWSTEVLRSPACPTVTWRCRGAIRSSPGG